MTESQTEEKKGKKKQKKLNPQKITQFKSSLIDIPQENIDALNCKGLRDLLNTKDYIGFMDATLRLLQSLDWSKGFSKTHQELVAALLDIMPLLAFSDDQKLHDRIQDVYYKYEWTDWDSFFHSRMDYVGQVCGSKYSAYVPDDWLEEMYPDHEELKEDEQQATDEHYKRLCQRLTKFNDGTELTIKVEQRVFNESQKSVKKVSLKQLSRPWLDDATLWKLDSDFPEKPGVYAIYYLGENKLYGTVGANEYLPVYIGMSTADIGKSRLKNHRSKIESAKDLTLEQFGVRFFIVDDKNYAPCIEGMLIEHFNPVWNRGTIGFSFGNGSATANTWNLYHIQQHQDIINNVNEAFND